VECDRNKTRGGSLGYGLGRGACAEVISMFSSHGVGAVHSTADANEPSKANYRTATACPIAGGEPIKQHSASAFPACRLPGFCLALPLVASFQSPRALAIRITCTYSYGVPGCDGSQPDPVTRAVSCECQRLHVQVRYYRDDLGESNRRRVAWLDSPEYRIT
jgi:hypothetical protein